MTPRHDPTGRFTFDGLWFDAGHWIVEIDHERRVLPDTEFQAFYQPC